MFIVHTAASFKRSATRVIRHDLPVNLVVQSLSTASVSMVINDAVWSAPAARILHCTSSVSKAITTVDVVAAAAAAAAARYLSHRGVDETAEHQDDTERHSQLHL